MFRPRPIEPLTTRYWPLRWMTCSMCDRQWRWSRGYRTTYTRASWAGIRAHGYFCPMCAPDHATAELLATDDDWLKKAGQKIRSFMRPPPPMPECKPSKAEPPPPPPGPEGRTTPR